ncbi:MAG: pyrroloquinoline quinone-dependent dehydrogenase [Blastocatellia bacterium]|nr:pyrroloquinoline quinone-dependent dehydrogenase [Blastocatellia bacterium]
MGTTLEVATRGRRWKRVLGWAGAVVVVVAGVFVYRFRDLITWPRTYPEPAQLGSVTEEQAGWPNYGRDPGGGRYSPLTQIHRNNVKQLKVAWTYHTGEAASSSPMRKYAAFEATPLMVDGTLYVSTPFNRVIALDARTGAERWVFDPKLDLSGRYSEATSRGVSTWRDPEGKLGRRIYVATLDARLIALEAATGAPCADFGAQGQVDLSVGVRMEARGSYQVTSPPAIIGDLVIVGSAIGDNRAVELERGVVRAFDARSGQLKWSWDPIPTDPADPARATWAGESAAKTGAANAWAPLSADPERGLVFVPTSSPSPDFYGGERLGDNRYANSIVALQAATGKVVWHYQLVHHDLWDYDVPAQPILVTLKRDGRDVPAVVAATKMGFLFVFHRETGAPLFPIEERPVPASDVAGEIAAKTQPFPQAPPALVPQRLRPEDAWGALPSDRKWCAEQLARLRNEGLYTPPSLRGTIGFPGYIGGINWSGMSFDPVRGLLVTNSNRVAVVIKLIPRPEFDAARVAGKKPGEFARQAGTPYGMYREPLLSPHETPCNAPPWGVLTAVDLNTGQVRWDAPLGTVPKIGLLEQIALMRSKQSLGSPNMGGSIVTAGGLAFIGAAMDTALRAFDIESGRELWKGDLPASANATPMTYQLDGRQFVAVAAGGHGKLGSVLGDAVVAFSLP